jgi:hypothetical protein
MLRLDVAYFKTSPDIAVGFGDPAVRDYREYRPQLGDFRHLAHQYIGKYLRKHIAHFSLSFCRSPPRRIHLMDQLRIVQF